MMNTNGHLQSEGKTKQTNKCFYQHFKVVCCSEIYINFISILLLSQGLHFMGSMKETAFSVLCQNKSSLKKNSVLDE